MAALLLPPVAPSLLGGRPMKYEKPTLVKHEELKQVTFSAH